MPEISSNPFLSALARSGLLDSEQFETIAAVVDPAAEPKSIASLLVREQVLTPWQAKFLLSGRDNLLIGKYALLERLTQDELGDKFLALHQQLGRRVDLQILPAELTQQADLWQRFLGETTAAAKLDSPALVHVYDVDQHQGRYYIVSEHFEARPLQLILSRGETWDLVDIAQIARQWLAGLKYAVGNGVLHRDLNSQSLLVAEDGTAKVGNMTLGSLSRRLHQADADVMVATTAEDDIAQLGRALLQFVDTCGGAADPHSRQRLRAIFDQLTRVRSGDVELPGIQANLEQWIARQQRAMADAVDAAKSAKPSGKPGAATVPSNSVFQLMLRYQPWSWVAASCAALGVVGLFGWWIGLLGGQSPSAGDPLTDKPPAARRIDPRGSAAAKKADSVKSGPSSPLDQAVQKQQAAAQAADESGAANPPPADKGDSSTPPADASAEPKAAEPAEGSTTAPPAPAVSPLPGQRAPAPAVSPVGTEKMITVEESMRNGVESGDAPVPPSDSGSSVPSAPNPAGEAPSPAGESVPSADPQSPPFAGLPTAFELPADSNEQSPRTIGLVHTGGQHLLALTLLSDRELTRKTDFELVRDAGELSQSWTVRGTQRGNREPIELARFWLEESRLQFAWLAGASANQNFGYMRNCVLKLECRNDFRYLPLRAPLQLPALTVSADSPQAKSEFELPFLPEGALHVVVTKIGAQPADAKDAFLFVFEPLEQEIPERGVCSVFLTQKTDRFFRLDLEAKIGKKSTVAAKFLIAANPFSPTDRVYSPKLYEELDTLLENHAQDVSAEVTGRTEFWEANRNSKELEGKITKFKETIEDAKSRLEASNMMVNQLHEQHAATEHLFGQPIEVRIYFDLGEQQVDLARFSAITDIAGAANQ